jgi:hypothetical protein
MKSAMTADSMPVRLTMLRSQRTMVNVPMKQVFKNSSHHDVTVRVFILGEPSMHKVMSPGDILSIPDIPGDYLIELVA